MEWDEAKNLANRRKHGISFAEAVDDTIRIISARWANQRERALYRYYMEQGR